jgi:hypothetical protein
MLRLSLRRDTLPPEAFDTPGKLGQFGATKPADRLVGIHLKPLHRRIDCDRATPDLIDRLVKDLAKRRMRMRVLPSRENVKDLVVGILPIHEGDKG